MTSFPFYRRLCDSSTTAFRKLGLLDEEQYAAALRDPRTVLVNVRDQVVPALSPVEHATGYDPRRARELTSREATFLLTVPPTVLPESPTMELPPGEFALLVENDPADTPGHLEALRKRFPLATVSDFADPRARNSTASMILYAAKLSRDPAAEPAYREDVAVLDADALRDDPKLTDALWALYGERFDWLGRHHPLSMEESQESFNSALFHHGTRTLVKFERDEPVCVGVFMIGLDECGWFAPACRAELEAQAAAEDANLIYFYGIAGTPGSGTAHTAELMSAFARTLWEYGKPCRLVFEATNLSSRYVPTLVTRNVRATPYGDFARGGDLDVLARVDYWYLDVR